MRISDWSSDVCSSDLLGDTTKVIDMIVDQSPDGLEVLRGASTYTYDGNWKLQTENGADGYHVSSTHWNYAATTARRTAGESSNETKAMDAGTGGKQGGGYFSYDYRSEERLGGEECASKGKTRWAQ